MDRGMLFGLSFLLGLFFCLCPSFCLFYSVPSSRDASKYTHTNTHKLTIHPIPIPSHPIPFIYTYLSIPSIPSPFIYPYTYISIHPHPIYLPYHRPITTISPPPLPSLPFSSLPPLSPSLPSPLSLPLSPSPSPLSPPPLSSSSLSPLSPILSYTKQATSSLNPFFKQKHPQASDSVLLRYLGFPESWLGLGFGLGVVNWN